MDSIQTQNRIFSQVKRIWFFLLPFLFSLILFYPSPTLAFWTMLRDALLFVPTLLIAVVLGFMILISGGLTWIAGTILDWITSPGFTSLSYTVPCPGPLYQPGPANCNPIVGIGLDITQHFVNLVLVIILVVIALSIALRFKEYGSQKIFGKLIIVAILVNFAPVFVGLIVDASNIVMNYFLEGIGKTASGAGTQVVELGKGIYKSIGGAGGELSARLGLLMQGVTQIIINFVMAIAFFIFAGIFLVRYVVIWILTILSPLAFVFWVLPATKKFWDKWWDQLIQWSIIGIPIAFFLYLAMNSYELLQSTFTAQLEMPGIEPTTVGYFNQVFPFFVIIVFLFLGLTIGLQTGAMGGAAVIGLTTKAGKATGIWGAKKGMAYTRRKIEESPKAQKALGAVQKLATLPSLKPTWGEGEAGRKGRFKRRAAGVVGAAASPFVGAARVVGRGGLGFTEAGRSKIAEAEKAVEKASVEMVIAKFRSATDWATKIGCLNRLVKNPHELGKALDQNLITREEIAETRGFAKRYDAEGDIDAALPHISGLEIEMENEAHSKGIRLPEAYANFFRKMKPDRTKNIVIEAIEGDENIDIAEGFIRGSDARHISKFLEIHGAKGGAAIRKVIETLAAKETKSPSDFIEDANPLLAKWIKESPGAQGLIGLPKEKKEEKK